MNIFCIHFSALHHALARTAPVRGVAGGPVRGRLLAVHRLPGRVAHHQPGGARVRQHAGHERRHRPDLQLGEPGHDAGEEFGQLSCCPQTVFCWLTVTV